MRSPRAFATSAASSGASASSSSSAHASAASQSAPKPPGLSFECNICLDAVSSPVVTLCGHLYCWPCLYQWMAQHSECPVCKAGISEDNVIPVYSRGSEAADPRRQTDANGVPERPRGQRPDPELMRRRRSRMNGIWDTPSSIFTSSPTLGLPSFFNAGGPIQQPAQPFGDTPLSPMEARQRMQQAFLSRLLLVVGTLVLICLLTF
ncbi:hypothetical protein Poli38472_003528 [Pythium oligandrum]|uniref:RING-type E3 ubiquitin transferase n=1 Tax=Pythium oligandrum TaxID=41045 RepID=A0A8K1C715_PYTOL|nr:hypothetical protein Poli38472_003528 [Pythium oligandrum]|eukprot:TMW57603.1 hypothetical protein Poli38472_003528 [Pythium oligandrum]